jgi:hypothetical protein
LNAYWRREWSHSKRTISDVTGKPPRRRRNGGIPVGFLGQAVLRKEQRDMTPEAELMEPEKMAFAIKRLGKHVSAATNIYI